MAQSAFLTDQQVLGQSPETADIARQRRIAELLMAQGMEQPQGQVISGHYVAPSWTQQLAPLAKAAIGTGLSQSLDSKQAKLAEALRGKQAKEIEQYGELEKEDKSAALRYALSTDNPILRNIAQEELKGIKLGEGEVFTRQSLGGGTTEIKGAAKYHAPTSVDMGTLGTMLIYPDGRREMVQKGREGPAGQVLETENGPMLINTRTGQAQPITVGGQPLTGAGKPLTESQGNATAFGMRAKEANAILKPLEDAGITNTGLIRSAVGSTLGMTPLIGQKLEQNVNSALNFTASQGQQATDQARRNFITAVLRKESGANIPLDEYYNEERKYFPQPGDSATTILQKQKARETAIKALEVQAGPGKKQIEAINSNVGGNTGVVDFNSLPKRN